MATTMDDNGSSIPAGASFYRYLPVIHRLTSDFFSGSTLTVVHHTKAFRDFQTDGSQRAFLVNVRTHVSVNLNPLFFQILSTWNQEASLFAERLQLGYLFDGSLLNLQPGASALAPPTQTISVSDTASWETGVKVGVKGAGLSFGVTDKVTLSVTDWLVGLDPASSQVLWDYWIHVPYDVRTQSRGGNVEDFPNISLVGFSFDTSAWFEIDDASVTTAVLQPALRLQVGRQKLGPVNVQETRHIGDETINKGPFWQPKLTVDLTRIPVRQPR